MLAVLLSGWFLAQFDFFVVNVAAPALSRDLGADPTQLELVVGGYAFAYAAGMITGGRLGDRFGHRPVFVAGLLAFAATTLLCGLAATPDQLVAARLLQGLAGAVTVPQVLATVTAEYPPADRARALGWYGVAGGVGSLAGQVLGGLLLDANPFDLGWRVVFLVTVPVGLVAAPLAHRLLPPPTPGRSLGAAELRAREAPGIDGVGAAGVAGAIGLALAGLVLGRAAGWPVWAWLCLAGSAPVGWATVRWERRLAARGGQPVLDLALFRERSYLVGLAAVVAFLGYFASFMFTLTLFLQGGLGLSALGAGLVFAPMGVLFSVTALAGGGLVRRFGVRAVLAGGALTALGLGALVVRAAVSPGGVSGGGASAGAVPWVVAALALVGAGNGLVLPHLVGVALARVRPERAGAGAAVLATAQQFAGSAGVAVVGTLFFAVAHTRPGRPGFAAATAWAGLAQLALVAVVITCVAWSGRAGRREPR